MLQWKCVPEEGEINFEEDWEDVAEDVPSGLYLEKDVGLL